MSSRAWSARRPVWIGLIASALLVGGLGGWSVKATIAGAVVAPGQIEVERRRQIVQHPDGGVVAEVLTAEGDVVLAGDPLITLDGTLLKSELAIVEGQYFELLGRKGRLAAEKDDALIIVFPSELVETALQRPEMRRILDAERRLLSARRETEASVRSQLERRRDQIGNQISGLAAQREAATTQLSLIKEELADQSSLLEKGLTQATRVMSLQREEAGLMGLVGELDASRAEAEGRSTEIDIEISRLGSERRENALSELRELGLREIELAERRFALIEQVSRLELRAPVSGIVQELQVTTPRAVIRAAEPILYIIPQDRPLIVAAQIAPVNIDEVFTGQEVFVRLSALDGRTTPDLEGSVTQVSADALTDERTALTYYRVEVELSEGEVAKLAGSALVPGMPVEVFIKTGDRSPLTYLTKPLAVYFNRAFREG